MSRSYNAVRRYVFAPIADANTLDKYAGLGFALLLPPMLAISYTLWISTNAQSEFESAAKLVLHSRLIPLLKMLPPWLLLPVGIWAAGWAPPLNVASKRAGALVLDALLTALKAGLDLAEYAAVHRLRSFACLVALAAAASASIYKHSKQNGAHEDSLSQTKQWLERVDDFVTNESTHSIDDVAKYTLTSGGTPTVFLEASKPTKCLHLILEGAFGQPGKTPKQALTKGARWRAGLRASLKSVLESSGCENVGKSSSYQTEHLQRAASLFWLLIGRSWFRSTEAECPDYKTLQRAYAAFSKADYGGHHSERRNGQGTCLACLVTSPASLKANQSAKPARQLACTDHASCVADAMLEYEAADDKVPCSHRNIRATNNAIDLSVKVSTQSPGALDETSQHALLERIHDMIQCAAKKRPPVQAYVTIAQGFAALSRSQTTPKAVAKQRRRASKYLAIALMHSIDDASQWRVGQYFCFMLLEREQEPIDLSHELKRELTELGVAARRRDALRTLLVKKCQQRRD